MPDRMFNLLYEPWILVMDTGGKQEIVSLVDALRRAHTLKSLAGEMAAQDAAVLRLLLAVLYAVFVRYNKDGMENMLGEDEENALIRWEELYQQRSFPMEVIEQYLKQYEDRFWLFHPAHPFYQVQVEEEIRDAQGIPIYATPKSLGALIGEISESSNKVRLFAGRRETGIPYGEAARWLLYLQSCDVAPAGTSTIGDGRTIKKYGTGWLSKLGLIWANGSTLFETLMLNLVMGSEWVKWDSCKPIWEQDAQNDAASLENINPAFPEDLCALYTMQFRRIHLNRNAQKDEVESYSLWSGQSLEAKDAFLEPMTVWKKTDQGYLPKTHQPSRVLWRDFSSIFVAGRNTQGVPGILNWLNMLKYKGILDMHVISLSIAGSVFTNNTAVEHIFSDSLRVNAGLLEKFGSVWFGKVKDEISYMNSLVLEAVILLRKLSLAMGDDVSKQKINDAIEQIFFELDEPFRRWLGEIHPQEDDPDAMCLKWREQARGIVRSIGLKMTEKAGQKAFVGREKMVDALVEGTLIKKISQCIREGSEIQPIKRKGEKTSRRYTSPEAYQDFLLKTSDKV